jgi:riboflavin kinase/FMN adenylyltransferase
MAGEPQSPGPRAAVTIGVFDGVHRGHQALLGRVVAAARRIGGVPVCVTFSRHPLALLNAARCPAPLASVEERVALLKAHGMAEVIVLDFDPAIAALSARAFIARFILPRYDLKVLVAGPDFAMGHGREGDLPALAELGRTMGFELEVVAPIGRTAGGRISSTELREAIRAGDLALAKELLGRDVEIQGVVVSGAGRGRGLGAPTANLEVARERLLPADGVYAGFAQVLGPESGAADSGGPAVPSGTAEDEDLPAVVNIGLAPTFGGNARRVEVHLLDVDRDLVGTALRVRLVARLRDERRFPDPEALKAQIAADVARARELLGIGERSQGAGKSVTG